MVSVSTELLLAFTCQRAGPLSLAATQGVEFLSFPMGTEMFQFPTFALHGYVFTMQSFRDPGINACLTASPGLSQPSTPFIAFWRQDIPHTPLIA